MGRFWTTIQSACGAVVADIEFDDVELNPYGVVCCSKCEQIISELESKESGN